MPKLLSYSINFLLSQTRFRLELLSFPGYGASFIPLTKFFLIILAFVTSFLFKLTAKKFFRGGVSHSSKDEVGRISSLKQGLL